MTALKQRGAATISQLAADLKLTGEAVRQHLLQLQREGWIRAAMDRDATRGRSGRPATFYRLTDAGEHLFPKHYDALAIALIDAMNAELGREGAERVFARMTDDRVVALLPFMTGRSLPERARMLSSWYVDDDPYMDLVVDGDDVRLIERNCPYLSAALERPALCSVTTNALSRLLGVEVEREQTFQRGDGRCVFRAHTDRPAAVMRPFAVE